MPRVPQEWARNGRRRCVIFSAELDELLQRETQRKGTSLSDVVRRAVREYFVERNMTAGNRLRDSA